MLSWPAWPLVLLALLESINTREDAQRFDVSSHHHILFGLIPHSNPPGVRVVEEIDSLREVPCFHSWSFRLFSLHSRLPIQDFLTKEEVRQRGSRLASQHFSC